MDNKKCKCGKIMIKRYTGFALTSYPPQYPWYWWCKCGNTLTGSVDIGKTEEELYEMAWEELNKENQNG
jgi:hypothetical protein